LLRERRCALPTEEVLRRALRSTLGAGAWKHCPAAGAELRRWPVLVLAVWTGHHASPLGGDVDQRLVVDCAPAVEVAVLDETGERIHRPLLALDPDDIGVRREQHRSL